MQGELSPALNALAAAARNKEGLEIANIPKGAMIDFKTMNNVYTLVAVDPAKGVFAVTGTRSGVGPDLYRALGSLVGGAIRTGWIGVDHRLALQRIGEGPFTTSLVEHYAVRDEPEEAARIITEAEARRTEREEAANAAIATVIAQDFHAETAPRVLELVNRFGNPVGKMTALGFLDQARRHDKLGEALELLERDWREHWGFQDSEIAGNPEIAEKSMLRWDAAHAKLGIPKAKDDKD